MNLKEAQEKYGNQLIKELLDIYFIKEGKTDWLAFCKKYKLTRGKYAYARTAFHEKLNRVKTDGGKFEIEHIYNVHTIWIRNGRREQILDIMFTEDELKEWQKENETN